MKIISFRMHPSFKAAFDLAVKLRTKGLPRNRFITPLIEEAIEEASRDATEFSTSSEKPRAVQISDEHYELLVAKAKKAGVSRTAIIDDGIRRIVRKASKLNGMKP